jgi:predicted AAA+ superfamily ATPase
MAMAIKTFNFKLQYSVTCGVLKLKNCDFQLHLYSTTSQLRSPMGKDSDPDFREMVEFFVERIKTLAELTELVSTNFFLHDLRLDDYSRMESNLEKYKFVHGALERVESHLSRMLKNDLLPLTKNERYIVETLLRETKRCKEKIERSNTQYMDKYTEWRKKTSKK